MVQRIEREVRGGILAQQRLEQVGRDALTLTLTLSLTLTLTLLQEAKLLGDESSLDADMSALQEQLDRYDDELDSLLARADSEGMADFKGH